LCSVSPPSQRLYDNTFVPKGIAPTSALKENIYATVLCLVAGVPLNITGPPGCGKTLAVQVRRAARWYGAMRPLHCQCTAHGYAASVTPYRLTPPFSAQTVVENMKGASSPMALYKKLPNLQQMPYQCSESSTAAEVSAVFDNAVSRSRAMRQHHDIILVFLDEAGLPAERREALKVIHGYLDHPEVRGPRTPPVSSTMHI
jgi:hypothetical protein